MERWFRTQGENRALKGWERRELCGFVGSPSKRDAQLRSRGPVVNRRADPHVEMRIGPTMFDVSPSSVSSKGRIEHRLGRSVTRRCALADGWYLSGCRVSVLEFQAR